ncbi:MAG: hypothetical protein NTX71_07490 [Candidatus Aureabacteria bacterium]|nr:hypothetical protein [Candidatus Auribacterota bacterium]
MRALPCPATHREKGGIRHEKIAVLLLLPVVALMAGCGMIKGAGKDIEAGSDATRDKVHDITH